MAGHFGALGFPVTTREELEALGVLAANVGEPLEVSSGGPLYVRWKVGAGVEVWAQAESGTKRITGVTPYFSSGEAALEASIESVLPSARRPLDGSIVVAGVPIVLPDFALARPRLVPGASTRLSVAAFAHAFEELPSKPDVLLHAEQGLTVAAGEVVKSEKRTNPSSRRSFVWCLVAVSGGTIDVLLDADLRDEPLDAGAFCRGAFWLCGRI